MGRCLAASILILLLLAGCGEDEDPGATTTAPEGATTAPEATTGTAEGTDGASPGGELTAEADSICARFRAELEALEGLLDEADSGDEFAAAIAEGLPRLEQRTEELEASTAASSSLWEQLIARQRRALALLRRMEAAAEAENVTAIQTHARDLEAQAAAIRRTAGRHGLAECKRDDRPGAASP